jgi:hypothetical protein
MMQLSDKSEIWAIVESYPTVTVGLLSLYLGR